MDKGLDPNKALVQAITQGKHEDVEKLIESGKVDLNHKDENGLTPLNHAAARLSDTSINKLVENGADLNEAISVSKTQERHMQLKNYKPQLRETLLHQKSLNQQNLL